MCSANFDHGIAGLDQLMKQVDGSSLTILSVIPIAFMFEEVEQ